MISYDPLWNTLAKRNISQYYLIHHYHISAGQLNRMKHNINVSTHTIDTLCMILNCPVSDVIKYIPE